MSLKLLSKKRSYNHKHFRKKIAGLGSFIQKAFKQYFYPKAFQIEKILVQLYFVSKINLGQKNVGIKKIWV